MSNKILIVMTFWPNASYIQRIIRSFLFFTLQLYVVYQIFASMVKIIVFYEIFSRGGFPKGGLEWTFSEKYPSQSIFRFSAHALCDEENYLGRWNVPSHYQLIWSMSWMFVVQRSEIFREIRPKFTNFRRITLDLLIWKIIHGKEK